MPGKSRRGRKGKYAFQAKRQGGASRPGAPAQQPVVAQANQPAAPPRAAPTPRVAPPPPTRTAAAVAKIAAGRSPYVATELRTIGILAGVMLVILIILARVLA